MSTTISEARLAANRENPQKCSGPVTPEGKAKSSLNAVKHGLTGATVLFTHPDDAANYARDRRRLPTAASTRRPPKKAPSSNPCLQSKLLREALAAEAEAPQFKEAAA
jgi:hypothetical protein